MELNPQKTRKNPSQETQRIEPPTVAQAGPSQRYSGATISHTETAQDDHVTTRFQRIKSSIENSVNKYFSVVFTKPRDPADEPRLSPKERSTATYLRWGHEITASSSIAFAVGSIGGLSNLMRNFATSSTQDILIGGAACIVCALGAVSFYKISQDLQNRLQKYVILER